MSKDIAPTGIVFKGKVPLFVVSEDDATALRDQMRYFRMMRVEVLNALRCTPDLVRGDSDAWTFSGSADESIVSYRAPKSDKSNWAARLSAGFILQLPNGFWVWRHQSVVYKPRYLEAIRQHRAASKYFVPVCKDSLNEVWVVE